MALPPKLKGPMRTQGSDTTVTGNDTTNVVSSTTAGTNPNTFLYDVGLQNIYQDYQKTMSTLNQQEQQSLQDAYYIREMSKKYLGEYASNTGIGDVSGNLLDIYGAYQQNVGGIRSEFDTKEMGLQQQYESTRRELETGKMLAEQTGAGKAPIGFTNLTSAQVFDMSGNLVENPNYIPGLDFNYFSGISGFDSTKQGIYINDTGVEYISVMKSSDQEADDESFNNSPTFSELTAYYQEKNANKVPVEGDIIPYENGANYVLRNGAWYRLEQSTTGIFSTIKDWRAKESTWNKTVAGDKDTTSKDVIITNNVIDKPSVFFNTGNGKYTNLNSSGSARVSDFDINTTNDEQKAVIEEFKRLGYVTSSQGRTLQGRTEQPGGFLSSKESVIEHNGKLYYMNEQ